MSLTWLVLSENAAVSNSGIICPRGNVYSPPLLFEPGSSEIFRAGLLFGVGDELVCGGPGFRSVLPGRLAQQQSGDDQPVQQLRLNLLALVLRQDLSARVQIGFEL